MASKTKKVTPKRMFKTRNPFLFGRFFLEYDYNKFLKELETYESCHGVMEDIEFRFFKREEENKPPKQMPATSSYYGGVESFSISDFSPNKYEVHRQVLVVIR